MEATTGSAHSLLKVNILAISFAPVLFTPPIASAAIDPTIHQQCLNAADYQGCMNYKKGIEVTKKETISEVNCINNESPAIRINAIASKKNRGNVPIN